MGYLEVSLVIAVLRVVRDCFLLFIGDIGDAFDSESLAGGMGCADFAVKLIYALNFD